MNKEKLKHYAQLSSLAYAREPQVVYYNMGYSTRDVLNEKGVQAFLLESNLSDGLYIVAIRGTDEPRDIPRDSFFLQQRTPYGKVHKGFLDGARIIEQWLLKYCTKNRVFISDASIVYVGHSLGGALAHASILTFRRNAIAVTFGSPMVTNKSFDLPENHNHTRVVNCNDIVPKMPSGAVGYHHHGELHYIDFNGEIKNKINIFDGLRARFRAWKKKQLFSGFYDHDLQKYIKKLS